MLDLDEPMMADSDDDLDSDLDSEVEMSCINHTTKIILIKNIHNKKYSHKY